MQGALSTTGQPLQLKHTNSFFCRYSSRAVRRNASQQERAIQCFHRLHNDCSKRGVRPFLCRRNDKNFFKSMKIHEAAIWKPTTEKQIFNILPEKLEPLPVEKSWKGWEVLFSSRMRNVSDSRQLCYTWFQHFVQRRHARSMFLAPIQKNAWANRRSRATARCTLFILVNGHLLFRRPIVESGKTFPSLVWKWDYIFCSALSIQNSSKIMNRIKIMHRFFSTTDM